MKDTALVEKWLNDTPAFEAVEVVESLLLRYFGEDAQCKKTGDSHQLRIKHPLLANLPGYGQYGHLSIPVKNGQWVKGYYLRRIAQGIKRLQEAEGEGV